MVWIFQMINQVANSNCLVMRSGGILGKSQTIWSTTANSFVEPFGASLVLLDEHWLERFGLACNPCNTCDPCNPCNPCDPCNPSPPWWASLPLLLDERLGFTCNLSPPSFGPRLVWLLDLNQSKMNQKWNKNAFNHFDQEFAFAANSQWYQCYFHVGWRIWLCQGYEAQGFAQAINGIWNITFQRLQLQELVWAWRSKRLVSDGRPRDCTGAPGSTEAKLNKYWTNILKNLVDNYFDKYFDKFG